MNVNKMIYTDTRILAVAAIVTFLAVFAAIGLTVHAQSCGDTGYVQGGGGTCTDVGGGQTAPANVVLTANPSTIQQGNSSLLSWGSDNSTTNYPYDSCVIDHGVGTLASTGSVSVSPSVTTTYGITCSHTYTYSNPCGNTNCFTYSTITTTASATVTVTQNPTLTASCSVAPNPINAGASATWSSTVSGGNGAYTYSWSGTDGLSGSTASVTKNYPTAGTKTGSVTVTSAGQSITQACGSGLTVNAVVNGTCGSANGTTVSSAPSSNLCSAGSPSAVSGSGPWTWTCAGSGGGTTASCSANKSVAAQPDLTASNVTVPSATAGTAVTLSATISNGPAAATGAAFTDLFQRADDSGGTVNVVDIRTFANPALAANGSTLASVSYPFPAAGTYYVRACADKSSAGNAGVITESNENNNCSNSWTRVDVAAAVLPALSCSVTPSSGNVVVPGSATYTASGASAPYTWTPSDGVGSYGTGATASRSFSSAGGPYGMTVSKTGYTSATCSPNVTATAAVSCSGTTADIQANPTRIRANQSTTLTYTASNVNTSCTITGPGVSQTISASSCNIPAPAPIVVPLNTIKTQATYTITCDGVTKQAIVNVVPAFQEF